MKNRLKELRVAKKLSQKEFAKAFNDFVRLVNACETHEVKVLPDFLISRKKIL